MKTRSLLLLLCLLSSFSFAQISHRNILAPFESKITSELIPVDQWKPFPQAADEWQKIIPAEAQQILIQKGEQALNKAFQPIPATVTLEFLRTGNRTDYEAISFDKRYMLWDMVLAEAIEGKGRFTDHIIDGIWSVCEESFWGINAHIGMTKSGKRTTGRAGTRSRSFCCRNSRYPFVDRLPSRIQP
jgi:hypothetical protein